MKKTLLAVFGTILALFSTAEATPKKVIIIRHAEKIKGGETLSLHGLARAGALPYYFSGTPLYNNPSPSVVFATKPSASDMSLRPIQTCMPIAKNFQVPLNTGFKHTDTGPLAQELLKNPKYDNATVLICWSHTRINALILALGGEVTEEWSPDIFDQVYLLTFDGSKQPRFQKILQKLMFGDRVSFSDEPFAERLNSSSVNGRFPSRTAISATRSSYSP